MNAFIDICSFYSSPIWLCACNGTGACSRLVHPKSVLMEEPDFSEAAAASFSSSHILAEAAPEHLDMQQQDNLAYQASSESDDGRSIQKQGRSEARLIANKS
jgi:hypothetical protein